MQNDMIDKKVGHFTILEVKQNSPQRTSYLCKCRCGKEVVMGKARLFGTPKRSPNRSCGCNYKSRNGYTMIHKRLTAIWNCMIARCNNPTADNYERYGKDDIKVCRKWKKNMVAFIDWALENGYSDELTLDRIDNEKGYSLENCRWVSYFSQAQNKRVSKRSKTGVKGVYIRGDGFSAEIVRDGVHKYLKYSKDINEAIEARKQADEQYAKYGTI